jgi:hypothetical protein
MPARMEWEREEARRLRREYGMKLRAIAVRLGVALGTVHRWTTDIELTEEQQLRNRAGPSRAPGRAHMAMMSSARSVQSREVRNRHQLEGRQRARIGDPLHRAGCMLYWAEGAKDRNSVVFANSDRSMVIYFVRFLHEAMSVAPQDITIRLNVYLTNGLTLREVEDHWIWGLGLPRSSLRKPMVNHTPTSSSGRKRNKLPYGVCAIRVKRSTAVVQHIYGAIQEYAGFEEPRWLDGPPRRRGTGDLDRRPRPTACSSSDTAPLKSPPSSPASGSASGST